MEVKIETLERVNPVLRITIVEVLQEHLLVVEGETLAGEVQVVPVLQVLCHF